MFFIFTPSHPLINSASTFNSTMQTLSYRFAIKRLRDRRGRRSVVSRDATKWTSHFDLIATSQCLLDCSFHTAYNYDSMRREFSSKISLYSQFLRARSRNRNLPDIFPRQSLAIHLNWVQKSAEFTLVFAKLKPHCTFNCAVCLESGGAPSNLLQVEFNTADTDIFGHRKRRGWNISKLNQRGTCKLGELQKQWFVHMY